MYQIIDKIKNELKKLYKKCGDNYQAFNEKIKKP